MHPVCDFATFSLHQKMQFPFPSTIPFSHHLPFSMPLSAQKIPDVHLSLLFSALDFSPGPKSQYIRLKLRFGHKLSVSFFELSGLVFKVGTPRTTLDLAVHTRNPRGAILCSDEDFHHVRIWKLGLVEQAAHSAFAVRRLPVAGVLCNGKKGKLVFSSNSTANCLRQI